MGGRGASGRGGKGGGGGSGLTAEQKAQIEWDLKRGMDKYDARKQVQAAIQGKTIEVAADGAHRTGKIVFNSNGVNQVLTNEHALTSEKKWAIERLVNEHLPLTYEGFEPLRTGSANYQKKVDRGYVGYNKYKFQYRGKTYVLGTAVVKDKYELPYYVGIE